MRLPKFLIQYVSKIKARKIRDTHSNPLLVQKKTLKSILNTLNATEIARRSSVKKEFSVEDMKKVSIKSDIDHADLSKKALESNPMNLFERDRLEYMAQSSGSTSEPKFIPFTRALIKNFKRFSTNTFMYLIESTKSFDILSGYILVTPSRLQTQKNDAGIHIGFGSGIMTKLAPKMSQKIVLPSADKLMYDDFKHQINLMVEESFDKDVRSFTSPPTFCVHILEHLFEYARSKGQDPQTITDIWPNFRVYSYSASSITPHREEIQKYIGKKTPIFEIYSCTESPIAFQYSQSRPGELLLDLESCFYLFQEIDSENQSLRDVSQIEKGKRYRIIITTYGGLINYNLGDLIEVTEIKPVLIKILGRAKEEANYEGNERINVDSLSELVFECADSLNFKLKTFFLFPYYNDKGTVGYHWGFEPDNCIFDNWKQLLLRIDNKLKETNIGYYNGRAENLRILPPKCSVVPSGSVSAYIVANKAFGQGKFLRVHQEDKDIEKFFEFITKNGQQLKSYSLA